MSESVAKVKRMSISKRSQGSSSPKRKSGQVNPSFSEVPAEVASPFKNKKRYHEFYARASDAVKSLYKYRLVSVGDTKIPEEKVSNYWGMSAQLDDDVYNLDNSLKRISASYANFCQQRSKVIRRQSQNIPARLGTLMEKPSKSGGKLEVNPPMPILKNKKLSKFAKKGNNVKIEEDSDLSSERSSSNFLRAPTYTARKATHRKSLTTKNLGVVFDDEESPHFDPIRPEPTPIKSNLESIIKTNMGEGAGKDYLRQIKNLSGKKTLFRKDKFQKEAILDSIHHQYQERVDCFNTKINDIVARLDQGARQRTVPDKKIYDPKESKPEENDSRSIHTLVHQWEMNKSEATVAQIYSIINYLRSKAKNGGEAHLIPYLEQRMNLEKKIHRNTRKTKYNFDYESVRNCHTNESLKLVEQVRREIIEKNMKKKSCGDLKKTRSGLLSKKSSLRAKATQAETQCRSKFSKTRNFTNRQSNYSQPDLGQVKEEVVPIFTKRNRKIKSKWDKEYSENRKKTLAKSKSQLYDRIHVKRVIEQKVNAELSKLGLRNL